MWFCKSILNKDLHDLHDLHDCTTTRLQDNLTISLQISNCLSQFHDYKSKVYI